MTELVVREDLQTQMKRAELLAQASLMPPSYTKQPANVLVAMEMAETLGITLMQAIQGITVISGKMSMSAEMMRALVLRAGHRFRVEVNTDQETTVLVARREWPDDEQTFTFTIDDAARAGLSGSPTWKKYPKALLLARVTSMACRAVFPDVVQGIDYVPEELETVTPAVSRHAPPTVPPSPPTTVTVATETGPEPVDVDTGEIVDADVVEDVSDEDRDFIRDLATWRLAKTSYDHTQRYAYAAMLLWGCPHLGYGSHMPQAIHRGVFAEAHQRWDTLADGIDGYGSDRHGIDEWSLVSNWGRAQHPELFWTPRRYRTLGWPQFPHQWRRTIRPNQIQFENFDPAMYQPGHLFEGIPTTSEAGHDTSRALVKIERWLEHDYDLDELVATERTTPLTASRARRAALAALRPLATAHRYLAFADREMTDSQIGAGSSNPWGLDADLPVG